MHEFQADIAAYERWRKTESETNTDSRRRSAELVRHAIENELTERQRSVFNAKVMGKKRLVEISREMNLNKSTVSRHYMAAQRKLTRLLKYAI